MHEGNIRRGVRYTLAAVFLLDGVLHGLYPMPFVTITPPWVPAPTLVVLLTGVAAFAGGLGLLIPGLRRWAGIGLALYCVGVYPANVHHALAHVAMNGTMLGMGYHLPRLLLQPVFTWACLWAGGVIDWPFRRGAPGLSANRNP